MELIQQVFARFDARRSLEGLHTDDVQVIGEPPVGFVDPRGARLSTDRGEELHAEGLSFRLRTVEEVGPDRLIFQAVWSHRGDGRAGSAGLYWGAVLLRDGKIARLTYCATRQEAERSLGAGL